MVAVKFFLLLLYLANCLANEQHPSLWPYPQQITINNKYFSIDSNAFKFIPIVDFKCQVLDSAIQNYATTTFINDCSKLSPQEHKFEVDNDSNLKFNHLKDKNYRGSITNLTIDVRHKCEEVPQFGMDEMYTLRIGSADFPRQAFLFANSVWGAIRGLETFSQLVQHYDGNIFTINSTFILDYPRFSHRGMLLDTSRHFISPEVLFQNLDLMAQNKLNVFHWHIVDDPSFPYVSKAFPSLSQLGAYNPKSHVYKPDLINKVIDYARVRGIRVLVEFDTPAHSSSWGKGMDQLLTKCYDMQNTLGPVDPTTNFTYKIMEQLFEEVSQLFPDQFVHLGFDEVDFSCWKSNPKIQKFMNRSGIASQSQLEGFYLRRLTEILTRLNRSAIVWQDVFDQGAKVPAGAVLQVWRSPFQEELQNITKSGYKIILSSCWYLNMISYGYDWYNYYDCDPHNFTGTDKQKNLIIGGEAALWGEWVDGANLIPRTWPRASAVAERLWSSSKVTDRKKAQSRLVKHRCRMVQRGFRVQPAVEPKKNGWGFCQCDYLLS